MPVDGLISSLNALKEAAGLFNNVAQTKIFALNDMKWADEEDESSDSEMTSKIEEGKRMHKRSRFNQKGNHRKHCKGRRSIFKNCGAGRK